MAGCAHPFAERYIMCANCGREVETSRLHTLPPELNRLIAEKTQTEVDFIVRYKTTYTDTYPDLTGRFADGKQIEVIILHRKHYEHQTVEQSKLIHVIEADQDKYLREGEAVGVKCKAEHRAAIAELQQRGSNMEESFYFHFLQSNSAGKNLGPMFTTSLFSLALQDDTIYYHSNSSLERAIIPFPRQKYIGAFIGAMKALYKLIWQEEF